MKRILILLTLVGFCFTPLLAQQDKYEAKLEKYLEAEKYQKIIKYKSRKLEKLNGRCLFIKGLAYYFTNNDRKAVEFFDLSNQKGPKNGAAYFFKGASLFYLKKYEDAISSLDSSTIIGKGDADIYRLKGICFIELKEADKAIESYLEALKYSDCNPDVLSRIGDIYTEKEKYDTAADYYKRALKETAPDSKTHISCIVNLGLCSFLMNDYESAKEYYKKVLKKQAEDHEVKAKLIQCHYALNEIDSTARLKTELYFAKAYGNLPSHMSQMFCFDQFEVENKLVLAFEMLSEDADGIALVKHKFIHMVNEETNELIKVQTEMDSTKTDSTYFYTFLRSVTLYIYEGAFKGNTYQYSDVKEQVVKIFENKTFPIDTIVGYAAWAEAIRLNKSDLGKMERNGTSYEKAVIVSSINEEYDWLREYYPGSQFIQQSLNFHNEKPYDILTIKTPDNNKIKIYFDISKFFGKGF